MKESRRSFLISLGVGLAAGGTLGTLYRAVGDDRDDLLLRPPGALDEPEFLAACVRCGQCVTACPFDTLLLAGERAGVARGTPYVIPEKIPCYLCQGHDGLKCIEVCPTSALQPVENIKAIRMGTAVILEDLCLAYNSVVCRSCWHACPLPGVAIRFDERLRPVIDEEACIGCGLCTHACPTAPTSIPIRPRGQTGKVGAEREGG